MPDRSAADWKESFVLVDGSKKRVAIILPLTAGEAPLASISAALSRIASIVFLSISRIEIMFISTYRTYETSFIIGLKCRLPHADSRYCLAIFGFIEDVSH